MANQEYTELVEFIGRRFDGMDRRFRQHRELRWSSHGHLDRRVSSLEVRVDRLEEEERS